MSTLIAILINIIMSGLGMQEAPDNPPDKQTEISVEVPEKIADETNQKC